MVVLLGGCSLGGCESEEYAMKDDWYSFYRCWSAQVVNGPLKKIQKRTSDFYVNKLVRKNEDGLVTQLEHNLGLRLPGSYRDMLVELNGETGAALRSDNGGGLLSVDKVEWFASSASFQETYKAFTDYRNDVVEAALMSDANYFKYDSSGKRSGGVRVSDLKNMIVIGEYSDWGVFLLNPKHIVDGEWEAVFLSWKEDSIRYVSFRAMMKDFYKDEIPFYARAKCIGFLK